MLFAYENTKEPILVHDNKVFVQKTHFDHAKFHPKELLLLTLKDSRHKQIRGKDIFLYHEKMTQDYRVYQEIKKQKESLLHLLRMSIVDESLADINHFPFGRRNINHGIRENNIVPYTGKTEFLHWIAWLGDSKAIPYIRELLFHGQDEYYDKNDDMIYLKDHWQIKRVAIETLGELGAKDVLFEYLFREPKPENCRIKQAITALMVTGLDNTDLPNIMKLIEKYEGVDKDAFEIGSYYLLKLFMNPRQGMLRGMHIHGVVQDRDQDAPIQRLLCKALARILTSKSVAMLEDIHKHALYREMCVSSLIGIRHRWAMQSYLPLSDLRKLPINIIDKINRQYCNNGESPSVEEWNMLAKKPMQSAFTDNATYKHHEDQKKKKKIENEKEKVKLAKNAEYFKTLKSDDTVEIFIPFDYDGNQLGKVISNDGSKITIESMFHNRKKIGKRTFWINNGRSCGPAGFMDDDSRNKPFFYELRVPQSPIENKSAIPREIIIPIIGKIKDEYDEPLPF